MQGIDARQLLENLLKECSKCRTFFKENAPLMVDEQGQLTDQQVEWAMVHLGEQHREH